ncbi:MULTISPECIES: hypothetical protein [unclassified Ruminococcus]|uniref:hypothetical protein n=1 Tax=unclassified Ruminococcus TaxID=2608920 RepID=UPI0021095160|nr:MULTISPECIES: hypothetical protein [unclassified Ruminococcus]MCQ4022583.1 hypothetical protein [Ruminococcus sp. zg-924]MCQ4114823.1 hypothetical protein [Ruminococcus sp. zg-921]
MKYYCNRCHKLYNDKRACPNCNEVLTKKISDSSHIAIVSAFGIEKDRITAALEDADIPYAERAEKKEASANAVTGIDNARYKIEVPYSFYDKAMEILIGINAVSPDEYVESAGDEVQENSSPKTEEFEEMSSGKRIAVRVISAVLFILLVALVIGGVDFITGIIKGLFV